LGDDTPEPEQGFVTSADRFVDRKEAGNIASIAKQLDELDLEQREEARDILDSGDVDLS